MPGFSGTIILPGESEPGLRATAHVEADRLSLSCATGQLGAWPLSDVSVERLGSDRFALRLEEERIIFLPEEPEGFARLAWVPSATGNGPFSSNEPEPAPAENGPAVRLVGVPDPVEEPGRASPEPADPFETPTDQAAPGEAEFDAAWDQSPESTDPSPVGAEVVPEEPAPEEQGREPAQEEPIPEHRAAEQESPPQRSLISESAATIGLVVLLAVLGTAGAALLLGSWSPFGGGEQDPAPAAVALPARSPGDLGMTPEELRSTWNRTARRIGSGLRIPVLAVESRPEGEAFRYSFGTHLIVTGVMDGRSGMVREVSVVGVVDDAFQAIELMEGWNVLLATADETLDEAARRRILHELGAFSASAEGGTVVFDGIRYTLVHSPVVGTWLTVTEAD